MAIFNCYVSLPEGIVYQLMSRNSYKLQGTFSTHQLVYKIVGKQHRKMIHFT
jgi:hypothetical protein